MRLIDVDVYCATICRCNRRACDRGRCPIHNAPTAYDIDKVVEELEEFLINFGIPKSSRVHQKIMGIVKNGCVADDTCEWKSDYGFISDKYKRETSCGYTFYDLHHAVPFKYCPYCGKKIKVV